MKSLIVITATALAAFILSGCATTYTPPDYNASHSRAYNIAHAGGLTTGIHDTEVPKDDVADITDSLAYGVASTAVGAMTTSVGLSGLSGGALGLLSWALAPKKHGARHSMIAWMPADTEAMTAEEAQEAMVQAVDHAVEQLPEYLPIEISATTKHSTLFGGGMKLYYRFASKQWNCAPYVKEADTNSDSVCGVYAVIYPPKPGTAPVFLDDAGDSVFAFTSGHDTKYHRILLAVGDTTSMPRDLVFRLLSKHLPKWVYLYLSPNNVTLANGDKIPFPYILNDGEVSLFVYP